MMQGSSRLAGVPRSGIRQIMELAAGRPDVIRLEVGEPDFDTPPHVVEAANKAARAGYTRYTSSRGLPELRGAISDKLARVNGITADPDTDVVVTAGAANGLLVALAATVDPGDTVLLPDPGWPNYQAMTRTLGLRAATYRLHKDAAFQPDLDEVRRLTRELDVRAIVLNSPGNPTGGILPAATLEGLLDLADELGLVVLADECYDEIVLDGASRAARAVHPGERVVSIFSLSKTYAMTGWRIGYLTGPAPLVGDIARLQEAWLSCCSAPVQKAAQAALTGDQTVVAEMVAAYRGRRDHALAVSDDADLVTYPPRGAFYLLVDLGPGVDGEAFARRLLDEGGVAVAPGGTFGAESRQMVRVSLAADRQQIETGLRTLAAVLGRQDPPA